MVKLCMDSFGKLESCKNETHLSVFICVVCVALP